MENTQYKPLPPWSEMPDWAMFRAVDCDGELYGYEKEPLITRNAFILLSDAPVRIRSMGFGYDPTNWQNSLEARPETQDAPELVPEVYRIIESEFCIIRHLATNKWYVKRDDHVIDNFTNIALFTTPQDAAEYWQEAQKEKK